MGIVQSEVVACCTHIVDNYYSQYGGTYGYHVHWKEVHVESSEGIS